MSCILRGNAFPLLRGRHSSPHSGRKEEHTSFRRKRNRLHIRKWRRNPSPSERKEETLIHFHHLNKHLQQNAMNPALQQTLRKTLYRHVETEHFVLLAPFKLLHSTSNRMGQINTKALRENIEGSVWRWGNENERTLQVESFVEADLVVSIVDEEGMEEWCENGSSENAISTCWMRREGLRLLLLLDEYLIGRFVRCFSPNDPLPRCAMSEWLRKWCTWNGLANMTKTFLRISRTSFSLSNGMRSHLRLRAGWAGTAS